MKNPRAKILMATAALCGALGLGFVAHTSPAAAAPITIAGCPASTGSEDTATISVQVDDAALANGAIVPLHDRIGVQNGFYNGNTYDPASPDNQMSTPVCGVRRTASGTLAYTWLYCTERPLNACANAPWLKNQGAAPTLTTLDKARIAWLLDNVVVQPIPGGGTTEASNRTQQTRAQRHRLVWCVTDHAAANAPAPGYLVGFEDPLNCPDWPTIDPQLNLNPQLSVVGGSAAANIGDAVTFTVTTNVSPLTVAATGLDSLALCAPQAGVSLSGSQLTIAGALAGKQVALCGARNSAGTGGLTVSITNLTVTTLQFWQRAENAEFCQGMVSTDAFELPGSTAQATASWRAVIDESTTTSVAPTTISTDPTTTTTRPPDVLETTVVPPGTLPPTGARGTSATAVAGLLLLLAGVGLVIVGRRTESAG